MTDELLLAGQAAWRAWLDANEETSDGVWLVELAAMSDPALVPRTIAAALGARQISGEGVTEALENRSV